MSSALFVKMIKRLSSSFSGLVRYPFFFWQGFKQWAINRGELSNITNLSPYLVLGLKPNKNKSINFYFLIARYFIWTCKMRNISPKTFPFSSHIMTQRKPFLNLYVKVKPCKSLNKVKLILKKHCKLNVKSVLY